MKSLFRSTSKPTGLLRIAILSACQQDQKFSLCLSAALNAAGLAQKVSVYAPPMVVADDSRYCLTFLMGCENSDPQMVAADAAIRSALAQSDTAYQVLYGSANERLSQALKIIEAELQQASALRPESSGDKDGSEYTWIGFCDKCSDPQCEYRLLTDLLANRPSKATRHATED